MYDRLRGQGDIFILFKQLKQGNVNLNAKVYIVKILPPYHINPRELKEMQWL